MLRLFGMQGSGRLFLIQPGCGRLLSHAALDGLSLSRGGQGDWVASGPKAVGQAIVVRGKL
jgi:hypothetical protein